MIESGAPIATRPVTGSRSGLAPLPPNLEDSARARAEFSWQAARPRLTFARLRELSNRLAKALRSLGIQPGDRIFSLLGQVRARLSDAVPLSAVNEEVAERFLHVQTPGRLGQQARDAHPVER